MADDEQRDCEHRRWRVEDAGLSLLPSGPSLDVILSCPDCGAEGDFSHLVASLVHANEVVWEAP